MVQCGFQPQQIPSYLLHIAKFQILRQSSLMLTRLITC